MTDLKPATPTDLDAIERLLKEMDAFYGATDFDPPDVRRRQIDEALFGPVPAGTALLAWEGTDLAGFAAYSFLWPAVGLTRSLYLKELYVALAHRQTGVGRLLMRGLFDLAAEHGCSRVEWTTDTDNEGALAFYRALGTEMNGGKFFYRAEGSPPTFETREEPRPR